MKFREDTKFFNFQNQTTTLLSRRFAILSSKTGGWFYGRRTIHTGQNRSDGGRCDLSELRQSQCVLRSVSKSRVWYLFFLWLIVAFGGYMLSVLVAIAGVVFWSVALVIRLKQNKLAKQYLRMRCVTCGTNFDVARSELAKGGGSK